MLLVSAGKNDQTAIYSESVSLHADGSQLNLMHAEDCGEILKTMLGQMILDYGKR